MGSTKRELSFEEMATISGGSGSGSRSERFTTANVRLRSSCDTSSSANIICVIPKGAKVKIVNSYAVGSWIKVTYNGLTGYIPDDHLE